MRLVPAAVTGVRVVVALIVVMVVVVTLLLNLRVDRLWANWPEQSGPCSARTEAACRYGFVN